MLAIVASCILVLGYVKVRQIKSPVQAAASHPPPTAVTTVVAKQEKWSSSLNVIGTAEAVKGVTVSADLPGIVERILFESGKSVREGEILVQLDTQQEQAQLAQAEAQRDLARINFSRMQELVTQGVISRREYDSATADQKQGDARVAEIRAM